MGSAYCAGVRTVLTWSCSAVSGIERGFFTHWLTSPLGEEAEGGTRELHTANCSRIILAYSAGDRVTYRHMYLS